MISYFLPKPPQPKALPTTTQREKSGEAQNKKKGIDARGWADLHSLQKKCLRRRTLIGTFILFLQISNKAVTISASLSKDVRTRAKSLHMNTLCVSVLVSFNAIPLWRSNKYGCGAPLSNKFYNDTRHHQRREQNPKSLNFNKLPAYARDQP